ncbi:MAG: nucleotidyltransferase domain-containing protein [Geminicoccaceae bacterium]
MAVAKRTGAVMPQELLDSVVGAFDPLQVIVYGSHARGEATADSDWDLLVIVDDDAPPEADPARRLRGGA